METLEQNIGYHFQQKKYLKEALTHSSCVNDSHHSGLNNERLEFLGDSVLSLVVSNYLFREYPNRSEGELTKSARRWSVRILFLLLHASSIWENIYIWEKEKNIQADGTGIPYWKMRLKLWLGRFIWMQVLKRPNGLSCVLFRIN